MEDLKREGEEGYNRGNNLIETTFFRISFGLCLAARSLRFYDGDCKTIYKRNGIPLVEFRGIFLLTDKSRCRWKSGGLSRGRDE